MSEQPSAPETSSSAPRIVECVPNFSEGRDLKKIEQITDAIEAVDGVRLLDVDPGAETNRTVVTFVGTPEAVAEGAFRAVEKAAQVIDMRKHSGAHSRHGATDVCPFVPVSGVTMDDCVALAVAVGKRIGDELGIPVYLYDQAAQVPERRSLATVRAGEYEALPEKLKQAQWKPDFGPATFNPTAGVVTVGAREFLIAYNVNLNTASKAQADDLALAIREKGRAVRRGQATAYYDSGSLVKYDPAGGSMPCAECDFTGADLAALETHTLEAHGLDLRAELAFFGRDLDALQDVNVMQRGRFAECRAVGWVIPEYGRAQISINLTNFHVTPAHDVLEACRELAADRGLLVTGSEVVGLVPYEALRASGLAYLAQQGSSRGLPVNDVIETAAQSMGLRDVGAFEAAKAVLGLPRVDGALANMSVSDLADEVSRPTPAPGGGSIAALAGALAASLGAMVANLTFSKKGFEDEREELETMAMRCQELKHDLLLAIDADTDAFNAVIAAMRLPRGSAAEAAERAAAIEAGYKRATRVPYETAVACLESMRLCRAVAERGNPASVTDAGVGVLMGRAGVLGAIDNVRINLSSITDQAWVADQRGKLDELASEADRLEAETRAVVERTIA